MARRRKSTIVENLSDGFGDTGSEETEDDTLVEGEIEEFPEEPEDSEFLENHETVDLVNEVDILDAPAEVKSEALNNKGSEELKPPVEENNEVLPIKEDTAPVREIKVPKVKAKRRPPKNQLKFVR